MPTNIVIAIDDSSNIDGWGLRPIGGAGNAWSAGTYPKGTVVTYSGSLYYATQNTSQTPGIGSDWIVLIPSIIGATGAVFPQGGWNATTNVPALASGVGTEGYLYRVSTAGTTTIDGVSVWNVDDMLLFTGGAWRKVRGQTVNAADIANSTAAGRALLTSADAPAQRTALGATSKGVELFTAADAAAARTAISAPSTTGGNASGTWGINITGNADGSAKKLSDSPGNPPHYACRAWVNFNGTGTVAIRESGNVSSITDNGTGDYTVNFTTAMPDANFAAIVTAGGNAAAANPNAASAWAAVYSTSSLRIGVTDNNSDTNTDVVNVNVSIFR